MYDVYQFINGDFENLMLKIMAGIFVVTVGICLVSFICESIMNQKK